MPSGAVAAAVTPIISAVFTCASLRFKFAALVVIEFGNIANSEVPRATRSDAPNSIDSDGTASESGSYYKMTIKPNSTNVVSNGGDKVDVTPETRHVVERLTGLPYESCWR